ncbi:hypothetical protein FM038_011430 [Shewanella eurypsychrophilus]|uniref:Tail specific protease domain-containing protein n=2 Tax=Shewanella TaxID=22 RepID=A0ABX6V5T1_9GAMM|nr:S41 family peptidase [Shewanella eurypsychrophilus]QPG57995.2 hypothetical protein FM038_011430 [Shewanella eurypsychrophilus]
MTNEALGQQPSNAFPNNGAKYWSSRNDAVALAKNSDWEKAIPLLEMLTKQYSDDGETWFLLGHGYLQTAQYSKAVPALEKTLELGTIMSGIPSASAPSNDIMIKIAQCYSALNDNQQALEWIQKALDFRWDDRKSLIDNSSFTNIAASDAFKKLSGEFRQAGLSRDKQWVEDLTFLLSEIKRLHVDPYHKTSLGQLEQQVDSITADIPDLTDQQIVFRMMQLLASVGNGHNFIVPTHSLKGSFNRLPVSFYWFNDGLYIVSANERYQHLIGRKVISVGHTPVLQALSAVGSINARDNEMQQYWLAPFYLSLPQVLAGLSLVDNVDKVLLTVADSKGKQETISLTGAPFNFAGFPTLPKLASDNNPAYLNNKSDNYWFLNNKEDNYLYLQFNAVAQQKPQSLAQFSREIKQRVIQDNVENLVLDLRHNSGGNGSIIPPLTRALIHFSEQNENNQLFVIVGRNTFSAAHLLLADLNRLTDAIIVGEPSGSRPNHLGEAGWFKLPYSGVWGIISSQYHQASKAEDHRIWIAPHLPVTLTSEAYFSAKDPAMEQIIQLIKKHE